MKTEQLTTELARVTSRGNADKQTVQLIFAELWEMQQQINSLKTEITALRAPAPVVEAPAEAPVEEAKEEAPAEEVKEPAKKAIPRKTTAAKK